MLEKDQKLTYDFLFKIIKKKYGISEYKHIRKYFIEGTGVPHFSFKYSDSRKENMVKKNIFYK